MAEGDELGMRRDEYTLKNVAGPAVLAAGSGIGDDRPALMPCRWRGPMRGVDSYECGSPKLVIIGDGVTAETCAHCYCRDHADGPAWPVARSACAHLGPETGGAVECPTCAGTVRLKLMACAVHGQCTTAKRVEGVACCAGCPDYRAPA